VKNGVVQVDWNGRDAAGEEYTYSAADEPLKQGLLVNVPTLIQYPDGRLATGNRIAVTPMGLDWLTRSMPLGARNAQGEA
jgi:hypothetical protein